MTTTDQFLTNLKQSNLLTTEQLAGVRPETGEDAKVLAGKLVKQKLLTRWQAGMLLAGKDKFYLGKYKLLNHLGQGGMGAVFKAEQTGINRIVALKVMSRAVLKDPTAIERFLREIRSAAALEHTNIVRAYDADCVSETYFLVMEYVQGRDLKEWIKQHKQLPLDWSCEVVRQAAEGLQHAHEKGLVHRDIKPANLLIVADHSMQKPVVKILDMGLARFVSDFQEEGGLTQTGQVMGTPDFIAPEQAQSTKSADIRADIFSLGCTLFQMLTIRLPFEGNNVMEKLSARLMNDAPRLKSLLPDVPDELDEIVAKMLDRNPAKRYQTPQEVVTALQSYAMGSSDASTSDQTLVLDKPEETLLDVRKQTQSDSTINEFLHSMSNQALMTPLPVAKKPTERKGLLFGGMAAACLLLVGVGYMLIASGNGNTEPKTNSGPINKKTATKSPDRQLAELVLNRGGMVKINLSAGGEDFTKTKIEELPTLPFAVTSYVWSEKEGRSSTFDKKFLRLLRQVNAIRELRLYGVDFLDDQLASLAHLKLLERLDVHGKQDLTKDAFQHLSGLSNLKYLDLTDVHQFTNDGLKQISDLTRLEHLMLSNTGISNDGLAHLKQLTQLEWLYLSGTKITDAAMKHLFGFRKLSILNLRGTVVTDEGLAHLSKLKTLKDLRLNATAVTTTGIVALQKVLPNCQIDWDSNDPDRDTAEWVLKLGGKVSIFQKNRVVTEITEPNELPKKSFSLSKIMLRAAKPTPAELSLLDQLTNLTQVDLGGTRLGENRLQFLSRNKGLRILRLTGCGIIDSDLEQLRNLSELVHLDLATNKVTDDGLVHFSRLKKLTFLDFQGNRKITGIGLNHLQNLKNLNSLILSRTQTSDAGLERLKSLTKLRGLGIQSTQVSATAVADLQKSLPKCKINWDGEK